ncbi:4-(cytidine 5'-diphospho)-2-C-methyl-D-erythritol kinase [Reinekea sp.]|jgi:4-diphosphocytidyl-2-C-methyl-D-erythritol kinase|uniref:4-(cytidine 5'-diphospho)-2-C-methyl-D-erythritol kinase n=1 Tax=Reinekea sp. TaxID=1970455 RepID=UPI003989F148
MSLKVSAPAKLNLFLHIVGRTPNGYHALQSIFQLLDFNDELEFTELTNTKIEFTCSDAALESEDNLVIKAAKSLQRATNTRKGARIHLTKLLPMGGGIGGGSSDAATTLLALNQLWQCNLSLAELADIGLTLGADIPVFVRGRSAWAEGIGEKLTPLQLPEQWFVVIHPNIHISTAQLFAHPELTRDTPTSTIRPALAVSGHNDFEPLVRKLHPDIETIFQTCQNIGKAKLTGTGSCLFISTDSKTAAENVKILLHKSNPTLTAYIARGVNVSTAHEQLQLAT